MGNCFAANFEILAPLQEKYRTLPCNHILHVEMNTYTQRWTGTLECPLFSVSWEQSSEVPGGKTICLWSKVPVWSKACHFQIRHLSTHQTKTRLCNCPSRLLVLLCEAPRWEEWPIRLQCSQVYQDSRFRCAKMSPGAPLVRLVLAGKDY